MFSQGQGQVVRAAQPRQSWYLVPRGGGGGVGVVNTPSTQEEFVQLPILEKDDKQLIDNNRPISLLSISGNISEKIIFTNL